MTTRLWLSVGMPRAGSGWYYNLTHDLLVAGGGQDAREIRERYRLSSILTEVNCNIGALTLHRLCFVLVPVLLGNSFIIKTHAGLTSLASFFVRRDVIKPLYIFRDPRDALLSAYEYGERSRRDNRLNSFSRLTTIEEAMEFMQDYVEIAMAWLACKEALHTRYEDLLLNYAEEASRIVHYLDLGEESDAVREVVDNYRPGDVLLEQRGMHLVKGKIGRYRDNLTPEQQSHCWQVFQPFLEEMGYPQ